ncbi:hypothetical protein RND81_02G010000 [Saponaria officinalis]|uniref:Histone H2A C-terminal domain-containing protein n=1 Tax=Saponaria officinalis TaxID=3572 RepID=A0AAW1MQ67_SAPOF
MAGKGGKANKEKEKKRPVSCSSPAGLQFPVGRIHRHLKARVSAHGRSKDLKVTRITPRHLQLAIRGDEELDTLIKGTIAGGGVIPHIHKSLMNKSG